MSYTAVAPVAAPSRERSTSYDEVPYDGWSYSHTHPDVLATVATLRGLSPAPIESCRVLEVGCAAGYNLMPMALGLPGSAFVGFDYARRQIQEGQAIRAELGIENVEFHHLDLREWDGSLGQFDYIIAHGVYSWVPADARDALLELCREALAPHGVAYISYNTYPGWHMLDAMRRMMLYHVRDEPEPEPRARKAQALIEFLHGATGVPTMAHSSFLPAYQHVLAGYLYGILQLDHRTDSLLLHDELEEVNQPVYFHEFLAHIQAHGLQYVGDAEFTSMLATNLEARTVAQLQEMVTTATELEQYLDFVRNRTFRRSLVCHQEVELSATVDARRLSRFRFASRTQTEVVETDDPQSSIVKFVAGDGSSLATDHPVSVVAFNHLRRIWPRAVGLEELLDVAYTELAHNNPQMAPEIQAARAGDSPQRQQDRRVLAGNLMRAYSTSEKLVQFRTGQVVCSPVVSERPLANPWARWQARERATVADPRLSRVEVDPMARFLLVRLDGTRTVPQLVQSVMDGPVADGLWQIKNNEGEDASPSRETVAAAVADRLDWLARAQLLVA